MPREPHQPGLALESFVVGERHDGHRVTSRDELVAEIRGMR
jgi:hypothetical protein